MPLTPLHDADLVAFKLRSNEHIVQWPIGKAALKTSRKGNVFSPHFCEHTAQEVMTHIKTREASAKPGPSDGRRILVVQMRRLPSGPGLVLNSK